MLSTRPLMFWLHPYLLALYPKSMTRWAHSLLFGPNCPEHPGSFLRHYPLLLRDFVSGLLQVSHSRGLGLMTSSSTLSGPMQLTLSPRCQQLPLLPLHGQSSLSAGAPALVRQSRRCSRFSRGSSLPSWSWPSTPLNESPSLFRRYLLSVPRSPRRTTRTGTWIRGPLLPATFASRFSALPSSSYAWQAPRALTPLKLSERHERAVQGS